MCSFSAVHCSQAPKRLPFSPQLPWLSAHPMLQDIAWFRGHGCAPSSSLSLASTVTPVPWETKAGTRLELGPVMCKPPSPAGAELVALAQKAGTEFRAHHILPCRGDPSVSGCAEGPGPGKAGREGALGVWPQQGTVSPGCATVLRDGSVPRMAAGDTTMAQSPSPTRAELCLLCHTGTLPMGTRAALTTGHRPWECKRGVQELQAMPPLQVSEAPAGRGPRGAAGPVPWEGAVPRLCWGGHVWGAAPRTGSFPICGLCQIFVSHTPFPKAQPQGQRPGTDPALLSGTGAASEADCPESPREPWVGAAASCGVSSEPSPQRAVGAQSKAPARQGELGDHTPPGQGLWGTRGAEAAGSVVSH